MCHSSERWILWSRRQPRKTTEPVNRSEARPARAETVARTDAAGPRDDERTQKDLGREKELERLS